MNGKQGPTGDRKGARLRQTEQRQEFRRTRARKRRAGLTSSRELMEIDAENEQNAGVRGQEAPPLRAPCSKERKLKWRGGSNRLEGIADFVFEYLSMPNNEMRGFYHMRVSRCLTPHSILAATHDRQFPCLASSIIVINTSSQPTNARDSDTTHESANKDVAPHAV